MIPSPNEPQGQSIRFAIMCNGSRLPAWQAEAVRCLIERGDTEVAILIVPAGGDTGRSRWRRLGDLRHLLWNLFNKGYVERRSRASRAVDMSDLLSEVPVLHSRTERVGKFGERFSSHDIEKLRSLDLDFILRFGFGILKGDILDVPRWGVWSFHHGDERVYRGRPPGFWELYRGERVVGAILQRLTEKLDAGVILYRGTLKTVPHSYVRTRDELFMSGAEWPASVVGAILGGDQRADQPPSNTSAPILRDPGNVATLRFLIKQIAAFVTAQWRGLTSAAQWTVGVADGPIAAFLTDNPPPIRWLPEKHQDRYLADPFGLPGHQWGLAEDYDQNKHRGVISAVDLQSGDVRQVLDPAVHASYPYLFESDGGIWCVPETYQASEVRLYRAAQFPHRWELDTVLLKGFAALDSTIVNHDGVWWLFCTDQQSGPNSKLRLFFAPELRGPWTPHPLNPVKTDIRSARPAGTPFLVDGILYRPAQDGSESYGGSITINRIDVLSPTAFSETAVRSVTPPIGRYRAGFHTISGIGDRTLVDGRRDTFNFAAFRRELTSRVRVR